MLRMWTPTLPRSHSQPRARPCSGRPSAMNPLRFREPEQRSNGGDASLDTPGTPIHKEA
jgi:hypothetical protein